MRRDSMTLTITFKNISGRQVKWVTCPTKGCAEKLMVAVDLERDTVPGASHCTVCRSDFFWSNTNMDPTISFYTEEELEFVVDLILKGSP